uniref:Uncharacterized protein n=1 Tax=Panagrellus redivivus TaxID=6233 RepID=A0A7E4ZX23_PANRE
MVGRGAPVDVSTCLPSTAMVDPKGSVGVPLSRFDSLVSAPVSITRQTQQQRRMFVTATKQVDSNKLNAFRISTLLNQCSSYEGTMLTANAQKTSDWLAQMRGITRSNTTWT